MAEWKCKKCGCTERVKNGKNQFRCRDCHIERSLKWQLDNKERRNGTALEWKYRNFDKWLEFLESKFELKCEACGYDKYFAALDFHHREPKLKKYMISKLMSNGCNDRWKKVITEEISKCNILCSNCHKELHYMEGKRQLP